MDKKHRFTLHVNMDDFIPATDEEKSYIVQMRPSTTFFKDGVKRLCRNKVALVSLIVVAIITLSAILIPAFWPYSYDQQLGVRPGKPVDASFNNLAPFEYGKTELKRIEEGEKVFPHVFGTDSAGRDYFIRVVYGTRISLAVGFFASLIVLIIGMTVVSIGTSLPEIMVATTASLHGQTDLAVGTALGSNITNILLILGLAALLRPFTVHSDILRRELPLMLLVSVLAGLVLYDGQLTRLDGLFLLALALLWLLFTIKIARLAERQGSDSLTREQLAELPREGSLPVALLWLGVAMIVMPMATRMVVDNSTVLANYFAISELTVGLTVVAIGTSLPELATAIAGARKGEDDIAIGNIIGANILNIALVLGLPALIAPGSFATEAFTRDYGVMLLVSLIFAVLCWRRQQQPGRLVGALLVGGFVVWLAMLFWTAPLFVE